MRWAEVQDHLRRTRALVHDEPDWCGWGIELDGWRQRQVVQSLGALERSCIAVQVQVCATGHMEPDQALRMRPSVLVGGLARQGAAYVLRQVLPGAVLTPGALERVLLAVAAEAARLHREVRRRSARLASFAHVHSHFAE
jgi:hypothetical protein